MGSLSDVPPKGHPTAQTLTDMAGEIQQRLGHLVHTALNTASQIGANVPLPDPASQGAPDTVRGFLALALEKIDLLECLHGRLAEAVGVPTVCEGGPIQPNPDLGAPRRWATNRA